MRACRLRDGNVRAAAGWIASCYVSGGSWHSGLGNLVYD